MNKREMAIIAGLAALASGCGISEQEKQRRIAINKHMMGDISKELQAFRWGQWEPHEKNKVHGPRELPSTMQKERGGRDR